MTSKSLFINLQKEDLKRRIWTIALLILVFFLILPVMNALNLESIYDQQKLEEINENIKNLIGPQHSGVAIVTVLAAILCGISGFFYLHAKKRIDFYHSVPIRRETLFAVNYINGFLIYFVTYLINLILSFVVLAVNGYMCMEIFQAAVTAIAINSIYFTMIYTIVVIAVMLTGNFVISCLGSAVLLLYGPTLMLLKEEYFREFFLSYYPEIRIQNSLKFLSPIWIYLDVNARWGNGEHIITSVLIALAVDAALAVFALLLYRKRPSEAAGKAMAFRISKPIIKFLLVVLLSLGGGALFFNIAHNNDGWFIFGLVFALLVSHAVIEIIYQFDIRGIFHHKRQLLLCAGIVAVISCSFRFDVFRFDSFLPEQRDIQSMAVSVSGIEGYINYFEIEDGEYHRYDSSQYQLRRMNLTDFTDAYALVKKGVASQKSAEQLQYGSGGYTYCVKYNLKNGNTVYRQYRIETADSYELLQKLYENKEFKEAHYPIYHWDMNKIGKVSLRFYSEIINNEEFGLDGKESYSLALPVEGKKEFIDTFKEELSTLSLDEVKTSEPMATIQFEYSTHDISSYYVYPSFTKTLALLEKYGFDNSRKIELEDIRRITISDYHPKYEQITQDGLISTRVAQDNYKEATYTKLEQITEILPNLVSRDYYYNNNALLEAEEYTDVILFVFNEDYNNELSYGYMFKKDAIPSFIKKDLEIPE